MIDPTYSKSHIYQFDNSNSLNKNQIQLFLDFNCPFSAKLFTKFNKEIIPLLNQNGLDKYFNIIFMNVIQPWHGLNSSSLHEVSLSIAKNYPQLYWKVSQLLFDKIENFYDSETFELTRNQLLNKIIDLIIVQFPQIEKSKIYNDVKIETNLSKPSNSGNLVAKDIKYFTRYHRTVGVHATPTVLINGIVIGSIESSTDPLKIVDILKSYIH